MSTNGGDPISGQYGASCKQHYQSNNHQPTGMAVSSNYGISTIEGQIQTLRPIDGDDDQQLPGHHRHHPPRLGIHLHQEGPKIDPFTVKSLAMCVLGMVLGLVGVGSEVALAREFVRGQETWWFGLTLTFVLVPLAIINLFSLFWFHQDHLKLIEYHRCRRSPQVTSRTTAEVTSSSGYERHQRRSRWTKTHQQNLTSRELFSTKERIAILISHCIGFGIMLRQYYIIRVGLKERAVLKRTCHHCYPPVVGPYCPMPECRLHNSKAEDKLMALYSVRKYYERDSAYLGLIGSFMQDAPQLMLQLYILAIKQRDESTGVAAAADTSQLTALSIRTL